MTSDRTIAWKKQREMILKAPVVFWKICCALLTAACGFFSRLRHKRREDVAQKCKSSNVASVYIVTRTPTRFTDLSEISTVQPKSIEA